MKNASKKGQYFSADAIIASVIFVLALSVLMSNWYSLQSQYSSRSSILQQDAIRISEILMRQPDPQDWYNDPSKAKTAGFAVNNSQVGVFDFYKLVDAQNAIMTDETRYNATRKLFATPLDFYIEINLTPTKGSLNEGNQISLISIGKNPINAKAKEIAIVKRGVVVREKRLNDQPGSEQEEKYDYHYGTLTLILWTNKSNI